MKRVSNIFFARPFHPEPNPKQGVWLAAQSGVHAMIDISDGLDCDLTRLIKSSQREPSLKLLNYLSQGHLFESV